MNYRLVGNCIRNCLFSTGAFKHQQREAFTPKISSTLNKAFEGQFPDKVERDDGPAHRGPSHNFIQPGRSYREELYASRRFELTPTQSSASGFRRLHQFLSDEKIPSRVRERRYFVRPGLIRHATIYAGRRKKFDSLVRETISKIIKISDSQK